MGNTLPNYPMSRKLKLLSLNARGLHNVNKRRAIFSYLKSQKAMIFCLQETYSSIEDENVWPAEWGSKFCFSFMAFRTLEVFVFFLNPHSTFHLRRVEVDTEGRFLIVKVTINEECFFITNVYALTDYRDQDSFICHLSKHLISNRQLKSVYFWRLEYYSQPNR